MDDDTVQAARRDLDNTACYLAIAAEPMFISVKGAQDLARQIRIVTEAYEPLHRAFRMVLAHLAAPPPN
jgi:hypothetical protein